MRYLLYMGYLLSIHAQFSSFGDILNFTSQLVQTTLDDLSYRAGTANKCSVVPHPSASLNATLHQHIRGQEHAVEIIKGEFSHWEFLREAGIYRPLVMTFSGPSGVGKSESAYTLGQAILSRRIRVKSSQIMKPEGYLVIMGQDFSSKETPLDELKNRLHWTIIQHMENCGGRGVIVIDEIQKMRNGMLQVILPGITNNYEYAVYPTNPSETYKTYSTLDIVFILISDVGADKMLGLMTNYPRDELPVVAMRREMKVALAKQWQRLVLSMTHEVPGVVPFLPLGPEQIAKIVKLNIEKLSSNIVGYWKSIIVDEDVIRYLASPEARYIVYLDTPQGLFAETGARSVESGPIPHISSLIHERMRPFNPKKVIRIRKNRNKIQFQWCDNELEDEVSLSELCYTQFESLMRGSAVLLSQQQ